MESHCYASMSGTRRSSCPLFLSPFRPQLPHREAHKRNKERPGEKGGEREMERREWKTRDGDAYNYLAFMYARKGSQSVVLFSASAFTRSPSPRRSFFLFLSFSRLLALLAASRARFSSFSLSFFFCTLGPLPPMAGAGAVMRPHTRTRARDEHEHERTGGQARMHTGKPKRSARE